MKLDEFFSKYGKPEEIAAEDYSDLIYDSYDLYKKCIKKYYITEDFDLEDLSYLYNDDCSISEAFDADDSGCLYKNN